jgi:hypothetical protein
MGRRVVSGHDIMGTVTMKLYQLAVRLGIAPSVLRDRLRAVGWDYDSVDAEVAPAAMSAVHDRWPRRVVGADGTAMCPCCRLPQRLEQDQFGVTETYCRFCQQHLGEDLASRLQRPASHEEMLRERLAAARAAADAAYRERDLQHHKIRAAYESWELAVRHLQEINALHVLGRDGRCSCGQQQACSTANVLYRPWVQQMIRRLDVTEEQAVGIPPDDDGGTPRVPVIQRP